MTIGEIILNTLPIFVGFMIGFLIGVFVGMGLKAHMDESVKEDLENKNQGEQE